MIIIKQFSMPQPLWEEMTSLFEAGGRDHRSEISAAMKHLINVGLVSVYRAQDKTGNVKFFSVQITERGLALLQVAFDLDIEMSWQEPPSTRFMAPRPMPAPTTLRERDGHGWQGIGDGLWSREHKPADAPVRGSDGPDGA